MKMAGPQVKQQQQQQQQNQHQRSHQSLPQRPTSVCYTGLNGAGGSGPAHNGITTSASHTGLHALRQISNESELIYRGSNGNTVTETSCTASTSRAVIHQQPHLKNSSGSSGGGVRGYSGGGSDNVVSIAGPGPSVTDALIVPAPAPSGSGRTGGGVMPTSATSSTAIASGANSAQRSIEVLVDATQCGKSEDDIEQGKGRKSSRHRHRPLHRRFLNYLKSLFQGSTTQHDSELEEFETPARYRPDSLRALSRATRFTEEEIKRIYRGFKAECPSGVVKEDTFKVIYAQFFPQGANPNLYAHYIFNTLDQDHTGIISFEDFVQGLSILSRGSIEEKLRWTFSLYDINGDGFITREELTDIVTAIYELMGRLPDECPEEEKIKGKVDHLFQKMDLNHDGVVTIDEFLEACRNDDTISRSMSVFDTSF